MYFSIGPKERPEDFFNYTQEYRKVRQALERNEKIVAITGLRRTGKTSMMNILYNTVKGINIWIDGRIINTPGDVLSALYKGVKMKGGIFGSIKSIGLSIAGLELKAELPEKNIETIRNAGRIHLFVDEAQYAPEIAKVLSYIYDRFPNISVVLSGSEIRVVNEVLGINEPSHPLYGRRIEMVKLSSLSPEKSLEFLKAGFNQLNISVPQHELNEVVDKLDGIIGWLTLYGYERAIAGNPDPLTEVVRIAKAIIKEELKHFLKAKKKPGIYLAILKYATNRRWKELLSVVRDELGKINRVSFARALKELVAYSFIEKRGEVYTTADPMVKMVALEGLH